MTWFEERVNNAERLILDGAIGTELERPSSRPFGMDRCSPIHIPVAGRPPTGDSALSLHRSAMPRPRHRGSKTTTCTLSEDVVGLAPIISAP